MGKFDLNKILRQPKYMLPLISFPFVIGILWVLASGEDDEPAVSAAEVVVDLPDAVNKDELSKSQLVENRIREEEQLRKAKEDSLKAVNNARKQDSLMRVAQAQARRQQEAMNRINRRTSSGRRSTVRNSSSKEEELSEFEKFKAEMEMLDKLANPDNEEKEQAPKVTSPRKQGPQPKKVSKAQTDDNEFFNTLRDKKQPSHIHAMVDEVVKGKQGSRVRIRLLDDIEVDGYKLTKGSYLYSFISGFSEMRVYLTIRNIMVEDQIIPVKLEIYDLDANSGLYVPKSNFTAIMQESGQQFSSSMRVSVDQNEDSRLAELGYNMLDQLMNVGTNTVGKNLSKNKARIKYNTQVILVNANDN